MSNVPPAVAPANDKDSALADFVTVIPHLADVITTEYGEDVRISHTYIDGEPYVLIESDCMRGEVLELPVRLCRKMVAVLSARCDIAEVATPD